MSLLTAVIFLGYYSLQARRVTASLRKSVDRICQEVAFSPMLPSRSWETFQALIRELKLPTGHVLNAELTLALMPSSLLPPRTPYLCDDLPDPIGDCGESVSCSLHPLCPSEYESTPYLGLTHYPHTIWKLDRDTGSAVGCHISAKIDPLGEGSIFSFMSEKTIEASVQWKRPFFRASDEQEADIFNTRGKDWPSKPLGLTLMISPHMTTYGGISRFQYSDDEPELSYSDEFRKRFDPLLPRGESPARNSFRAPTLETVFSAAATGNENIFIPDFPALSTNTHRGGEPSPFGRGRSDFEEMMVACMNPPALIRNIMAATIVDLASRDIRLRSSTEIIIPGTQHELRPMVYPESDIPSIAAAASYFPNTPIVLVEKGDDLRRRAYQLPYVSYYGGVVTPGTHYGAGRPFSPPTYLEHTPLLGTAPITSEGYDHAAPGLAPTSIPPVALDLKDGWILPFANKTGSAALPWDPIHARTFGQDTPGPSENDLRLNMVRTMISSQLRWCLHLFSGDDTGLNADFHKFARTETYHEENKLLEPSIFSNSNKLIRTFPVSETATRPWDARCNSEHAPGEDCQRDHDLVNAYELLMHLGTIQQCPFELGFPNDPVGALSPHLRTDEHATPYCQKPPLAKSHLPHNPPFDLKPDLLGAGYFLYGPLRLGGISGDGGGGETEGGGGGDGGTRANQPDTYIYKPISFKAPVEVQGSSSVSLANSYLGTYKLPARRSPGIAALRKDYSFLSAGGLEAGTNKPRPAYITSPPITGSNPIGFIASDDTNPLLPFDYQSQNTIYIGRPEEPDGQKDASSLIIFLHTPPGEQQMYSLATMLKRHKTIGADRSPSTITVVYIPTSAQTIQGIAAEQIMFETLGPVGIRANFLHLGPTEGSSLAPLNENVMFKEYWKNLLNPNRPGNVVDLAESLYFSLFGAPRKRF